MNLLELTHQRGEARRKANALLDKAVAEGRPMTASETAQFDSLIATIHRLDAMGSGSGNGTALALANRLATNAVGHELKLLADGKPASAVYTTLLPGYLHDKTGLEAALCAAYCQRRLAGGSQADAVAMLTEMLLQKS